MDDRYETEFVFNNKQEAVQASEIRDPFYANAEYKSAGDLIGQVITIQKFRIRESLQNRDTKATEVVAVLEETGEVINTIFSSQAVMTQIMNHINAGNTNPIRGAVSTRTSSSGREYFILD